MQLRLLLSLAVSVVTVALVHAQSRIADPAPVKHQHIVSTDRLEAGAYVYAIATQQGRLMSRFVVQ